MLQRNGFVVFISLLNLQNHVHPEGYKFNTRCFGTQWKPPHCLFHHPLAHGVLRKLLLSFHLWTIKITYTTRSLRVTKEDPPLLFIGTASLQ